MGLPDHDPPTGAIDRWAGEVPKVGGADGLGLELRVSLNSEEEEPAARAAIGFAYTGRVQASSMREALEVRRQAAYLQVEGCLEACDEFIRGRLQAASGSSSNGRAHDGTDQPPVLEFFGCAARFPDPAEEPSFAAVLACAKQVLVPHFPDVLAVLNTRCLRKQLLALPAVAVEALLESDAFGTDTEASVLSLLATWMTANFKKTDAPTRKRLCRLVRLVQLDRTYLSCVVPALAAAFSMGDAENSPCAWFPIGFMEAAFITNLSFTTHLTSLPNGSADDKLARDELLKAANKYDLTSPWYSFAARPPCKPDKGTTYKWSISEQKLKEVLEAGGDKILVPNFQNGLPYVVARGFVWSPRIEFESGASAAGLFLNCRTSSAYQVHELYDAEQVAGIAWLDAHLAVHCWEGDTRARNIMLDFDASSKFCIGRGMGVDDMLPLLQPAGMDGNQGPLAAWGRYLHGGKLSGSLRLRPPPPVAELFGSDEDADCRILFCVKDRVPGEDGASGEAGVSPFRLSADDDAAPSRKTRKVEREMGSSLPGHKFVLRRTSEWFRTKIDRWAGEAPKVGGVDGLGLELRVSLNSEDEEPAARAAIGFAYTGRVQAGSMREALEVWRQAGYLQVEGCLEACDEFIRGRLQAASGSSINGRAHDGTAQPPVLEFFGCAALFPGLAEDPRFIAVLACTKQALVPHLPDALAVLNTHRLCRQLLAMPAVAVEALLESDAFGTDTEASVLLLLAVWMKFNFDRTDAPTRERLCRLVRLVQLNRTYLSCVLPAMAAAFSMDGAENSPRAWFPIGFMEAAFITNFSVTAYLASLPNANADDKLMWGRLEAMSKCKYDLTSPRYSFAVRPQCVLGEGTTNDWSISEQELKKVLEAGGDKIALNVFQFQAGVHYVVARGLVWSPRIELESGASAAGLYLICRTFTAYQMHKPSDAEQVTGVVCLDAHLAVHSWEGGSRSDKFSVEFGSLSKFCIGSFMGDDARLPLLQPAAMGGNRGPLAAWGRYLHEGKLTGSLTLLPPPPAAAGAVAVPH
ncbi:hypothetical protein TSOC_003672 [Tetrabaena socialis]|uniref:Uncharacterized protein n=1 Tax=Tetrabaena socialis TaxID=47790 RepID=A0A2J8AAW2_9CHLO|nr:hypothetical protein TSOC_003672 [Tetrabaena socialis]|eukprot:PNH09658.1 hypothetical protein TSOC_003672 [Tetrabaena socialis]